MTITAKNVGRINVWPTYDAAREVDTEESEFVGRLTVYRTNAEARANLTSEGGGGKPDWVPANAVIHIDLVRAFNDEDAAWTAADGVVAEDTLLGSDAASSDAWGSSEYDPENLTADGYTGSGDPCAAIGTLRTMLQAGATVVVQWMLSANSEAYPFLATRDDGSYYLNVKTYSRSGGSINVEGGQALSDDYLGEINAALNVVAITTTPTRFELAFNGLSVHEPDVSEDMPVGGWLVFLFQAFAADASMCSVTLYDALPSTAGLSELSEVA